MNRLPVVMMSIGWKECNTNSWAEKSTELEKVPTDRLSLLIKICNFEICSSFRGWGSFEVGGLRAGVEGEGWGWGLRMGVEGGGWDWGLRVGAGVEGVTAIKKLKLIFCSTTLTTAVQLLILWGGLLLSRIWTSSTAVQIPPGWEVKMKQEQSYRI